MINPAFEKLSGIVEEIQPILKNRLPNEYESLLSKTEAKLNESAISVHLYGAYNAGKSSFINLLIGESVAKTGDQPVTDVVEEFSWQGLRLLDSPGVNAPIEHENVTMDSLKSVDLVVFIIRFGDHDSKDLYTRLIDLLNNGKHVFLIFNYEGLNPEISGEGGTAHMVDYIRNKITEYMNLHDHQTDKNLLGKLDIIPLNIKTADKGLRENKNLLVERSGFLSFENTFNKWIDDLNNEKQLVEGSKKFISTQLLEPLTKIIDQGKATDSYQEQKIALTRLEHQKERFETSASNQIRIIANNNQGILQNGFENIQSESQAKDVIENYFFTCGEEFNQWLANELEQGLAINLLGSNSNYDFGMNSKNADQFMKSTLELGTNYLKNNPELVKNMTRAGLEFVKKTFPSFMKGIGKVGMDKIAGRAMPVLGIITTAVDMYSASSKQDEINQAERNRVHQQVALVNNIKEDFISATKKQSSELIEGFMSAALLEVKSTLTQLNKDLDLTKSDNEKLLAIKLKLDQV